MEKKNCWEIMGCGKTKCPAFGNTRHRCWYMAGTLCPTCVEGEYAKRIESCHNCHVYRRCSGDEIQSLAESFDSMTLTLKTLQFNLYKGLFTGSGQFDLRDKTPQFYVKSELKDVNVKELINDNTTQKDIVWGTLNSNLSLFGRGTDMASITRTLNGKGEFAVTNGEIKLQASIFPLPMTT